jgi:hypothetical protein
MPDAAAGVPDASTPLCRDDQSCVDAESSGSDGGVVDVDAGFGPESGLANDGGAECITGCARGAIACSGSDPPMAWTCTGPGISSGGLFLEAGCTSVPIDSVAWCCPATFLSQCACTPGEDQTCNDDPAISSIHGMCLPDHSCSCAMGFALNPVTGRCK